MEDNDEDEIQHNVEQSGQYEKIQGHFAVPEGTQNTCKEVVQHLSQDTAADNHDICIGICENIRGCSHQLKPWLHQDHKRGSQNQSDDQGKDGGPGDSPAHSRQITSAKFLGGQHGKSCSHPDHESINQKHDCPGASHSC